MKEFTYAFLGLVVGFIIAYFLFKKGDEGFNCTEGNIQVQYCIDSSSLYVQPDAEIDARLLEYYRGATAAGDTVGFTLRKQTIMNFAAYLQVDQGSEGLRFYPGKSGSDYFLLVKPIDRAGKERPDLGGSINIDPNILEGPCPKWCGNDGRIIIDPQ